MTTATDTLTPVPVRTPILLRRPMKTTGVWSWFSTVDHKKIGILYAVTALVFFVAGGLEALLIRLQLAQPNGKVLTAAQYNQLFTMHGTTMVFLLGMPRYVAFPRLNAFGYFGFVLGGVFLYSSFLFGGAPNGGWFGYTPLTSTPLSL